MYPPRRVRLVQAMVGALAIGLLGGALPVRAPAADARDNARASVPARKNRPALTPAEASQVGAYAAAAFHGELARAADPLPPAFVKTPAVVYVAARTRGDRVRYAWHQADRGDAALASAVQWVAGHLDAEERAQVTTLEIDLGHSFRVIDPLRHTNRLSNVYRGLLGVELLAGGRAYRYAPTEMIAMNLGFDNALDRLAEQAKVPRRELGSARAQVRLFEADQLLVELLAPGPATTLLYRGNTLVRPEDITRASVQRLVDAQATWLVANLQPDGRMVYLYWPSRGEESGADNTVRQWMATVALGRAARARADTGLVERVEANIRHNLARYYQVDDAGHGQIVEDGTEVKLGAVALACLALVEHPGRARFAPQEAALRKTIDALWQTNGEFRTFWRPRDRADNVNFYPGEALLLWATLFEQSRDPALLERIMTSLRYYRTWHLANRNPAFIPWHTQAYAKVWHVTRADEVRDWIFEMNDWLLEVQQWDEQREFPDTMGRFYDPRRPFGPPHSSSTGVYLEGLIEAWRVAVAASDTARQEAYRRVLMRGLRSVMQETFLDDADLFYIAQRSRAYGGVRATVYDNSIRVDSVQHCFMAALRILELVPAADFRAD